jgi:nucleotide-binding universal stress UspA family protein
MPARHTTRRILVPLDGSDLGRATIPHLRALATVHSEILLLRVLTPELPDLDAGAIPAPELERSAEIERCNTQLRTIATALADITPYVEQLTSIGRPAEEILRVAENRGVDLILMATHGFGTPEHPRADSVTNRVAQAATVPVMILPPHVEVASVGDDGTARYGHVVVPLDGSARARVALPIAAALAGRQCCPVRPIRAMPPREQVFPPAGTADPARERDCDRYYTAWRASLADALDADTASLPPSACREPAIVTGPPVPAILDAIAPGDIIVLASHGEGGVRPWLLGSVAQQLIGAADTPVVLVPVEERRALTRTLRHDEAPVPATRPHPAARRPDPVASRQHLVHAS